MESIENGANLEVLSFYKELPFNYASTVDQNVDLALASDPVEIYPVLKPLLKAKAFWLPFFKSRRIRVFEVGCGVGWLSNAIAHYHAASVTALDFNPVAVQRARDIASALGTDAQFEIADLFTYQLDSPADISISLGVLHHTNDCLGAMRRMFNEFTISGGHCFIGLYHAYGRKPFLDHFASLKAKGLSNEALLDRYRKLDSRHTNEIHLQSWFRDQVLHPHETQHTLAELLPVLADCGMTLEATSINGFESIRSVETLLEEEKRLEIIGQERLEAGTYYPGFFAILARKN
jgi:SAM-dependent methyltransferase